jgi:eukaryotic-like serine/threonine-protein kinase
MENQRILHDVNMLCAACGNECCDHSRFCPNDQTLLVSMSTDNRLGIILAGRYEIIEVIKSGGMGTVYKAQQLLMNRIVAIKMLHMDMLTNTVALKRFRLEAQAVSRLGMPNILTIYDFGVTPEGQPYMVMPYLDGLSLDEVMAKDHRISACRVLDISIQICAALSHAHSHGVLHRDIKPSNIMLVNDDDRIDFVKIVDFGIAKIMNEIDNSSCTITKTGALSGSPAYMSPEQCYGAELDARSDIYSLGCVMYTTLTGHNFFDSNGMLQTMQKHINDMPPSFSDSCPEIELPHDLECAVLKALAKRPEDRFQTMNHFEKQLREIQRRMTEGKPISEQAHTSAQEQQEEQKQSRSSSTDASLPQAASDKTLAVNNVNEPLLSLNSSNLAKVSLHASKMTFVSVTLAGAAMFSMLIFPPPGNLNKPQKDMVQSKQSDIVDTANSAQSESIAVKRTDVAKKPHASNPSHRAVRKHSVIAKSAQFVTAPTPNDHNSREGHRHAYSSY